MNLRSVVLVALASGIVLAGCSSPQSLPAGPTAYEVSEFLGAQRPGLWSSMPLPARIVPPDVELEHVVPIADWPATMARCMTNAGFQDYEVGPEGELTVHRSSVNFTYEELVAFYVCEVQYPEDPTEGQMLGSAQRDYVYTYYERWLVPCLILSGYQLSQVPSRSEFVDDWRGYGWWSPYESIGPLQNGESYSRLLKKCPALPEGLFTA
jgi:hypothetical protein